MEKWKGFLFFLLICLQCVELGYAERQRGVEQSRVQFSLVKKTQIPDGLRVLLPAEAKEIFLLEGEMRQHLFQGTLDEVKPILAKKAAETQKAAALLSKDGTRFSVVIPDKNSKLCKGRGEISMVSKFTTLEPGKLGELSFCHEL